MAAGSAVKLCSFTRPLSPWAAPIRPTRMSRSIAGRPLASSPLLGGGLGRRGRRLGALLRLGLGQMLLALVAALRRLAEAGLGQEQGDAVGRLGALAQPILDALDIELHP